MIVDNFRIYWQYDGTSVACYINRVDDDSNVAIAIAHTGKKDVFCKEKGRRLSLARALDMASKELLNNPVLQKKWRSNIWEFYRKKMTKNPRWRTPEDLADLIRKFRTAHEGTH